MHLRPFLLLSLLTLSHAAPTRRSAPTPYSLTATAETGPAGTDGDDPTIWVHPKNPSKSLVITTSKKEPDAGLFVFDLSGKQVQFVQAGKPDNVDVIYGLEFEEDDLKKKDDDEKKDLVVAACRTDNTICMWGVGENGLEEVEGGKQKVVDGFEVYGSCVYKSKKSGKQYVFINSKTSEYLQYEVATKSSALTTTLVRRFKAGNGGQVEGCVADDDNGFLFLGEEDNGLWRYDAEPNGSTKGYLIDSTSTTGNLVPDVEGVSLFYGKSPEEGYLIVSVQGISAYNVYTRAPPHSYLFSFNITANPSKGIDEVTETDGLSVVSTGLGKYEKGLLVVHDDHKTLPDGSEAEKTTFKYVDFGEIVKVGKKAGVEVKVNPKWDPRGEDDEEDD